MKPLIINPDANVNELPIEESTPAQRVDEWLDNHQEALLMFFIFFFISFLLAGLALKYNYL